nr:PREDICTED: U3 small nucleolar RNA-associated protein 18 homolog [Bemisia tabaci]
MAKVSEPVKQKKRHAKSPPAFTSKKKKIRYLINDDTIPDKEEEERLEKFLFDETPNLSDNDEPTPMSVSPVEAAKKTSSSKKREPAWHDEDDEVKVEAVSKTTRRSLTMKGKSGDPYYDMLKKKFEAIVGTPSWARLPSEQDDQEKDSDDEEETGSDLKRRCGNMISSKSAHLPKGKIAIKELTDLNRDSNYIEGRNIEAVEFHTSSSVALVAGAGSIASIFHVDGRDNAKLQSIRFERFPIQCAHFTRDGEQFIVGSQHGGHFYCYDMVSGKTLHVPMHHALEQTSMKNFVMSPDGKYIVVCGKFGNIHFLSSRSKEFLFTLKMNGNVGAVCFNSEGSSLYSHGDEGEVYIWDVASRRCVRRFYDEGCIKGKSIAMSPNDQLLATGSSVGTVNIYKLPISSNNPTPIKTVMNLVTSITILKFNASSEILAMASGDKPNALKLVHFPSLTVFSNFPAMDTYIKLPFALDFSPSSGYLAVGNNRSKVKLFRLNHFKNY